MMMWLSLYLYVTGGLLIFEVLTHSRQDKITRFVNAGMSIAWPILPFVWIVDKTLKLIRR